jgi:16S rRNA (uracil1498-N3)-methyltransferase
MQRYFALEKKDNSLILNNDDLYHIKKVMRMNIGDEIIVVYEDVPYLCEVLENAALIKEQLPVNNDKMPYVRLIIPLLKEQKMDFILQKSTELGVSEIVLYIAKRSMVKVNEKEDKKKIRWQKIMKEASEQSHRNTIPILSGIYSLSELDKFDGLKLVCSTREKEKNVKKILKLNNTCDTINVVIGPEGGLEETEEDKLIKMGYISVSCGSRIMRVETVPLFFLSILNYENME